METNVTSKILAFCREHKKYVILFGIYLICFIISMAYNPWDQHFSYELMGETYDTVYSPETEFYNDYKYYAPGSLSDENSVVGTILTRLLSFGAGDLMVMFSLPKMSGIYEVLRIVFPMMMFLKAVVMKRLFAKEKDPVMLDRKKFTLLYYRSESIIAEIAADNITFFLIGVLTQALYVLFLPSGGAVGNVLDFIYCILLIPCFIPFVVSEWMVGMYSGFWGDLLVFHYDANRILIFFISIPLMSLALVLCFEITLRFSARLVTIIGGVLGRLLKNTKTLVTEKINT